jgi:hypothetical protein
MADEYPDNKYEGLYLGEPRTETNIDLNAIPPNGKRPESSHTSQWVFPGKPGID